MIAVALAVACESPARVKPWRHAPDPIAEAKNAPRSPALAETETEVRAARGHTLRIQLDADVGRLNPLVAPSTWARRILNGPVFEPLIRYVPPDAGPDAGSTAGRYEPRLARSWRVVNPPWGGLEVRIELEPNATFHDGHPLTSVDVQFTLDAIRDPRHKVDHLRPMLDDVAAVELITPTEVRLVLNKANGWVLRALAEIPILPMHVYNDNLAAGGVPVGSGPWKVTSTKGGTIHLTRYEKYWAGKAAIADVEFVYQPDAALALKEAKRGDFDIIPALIPVHYPGQATAPGIAASFKPLELSPPKLRLIAFNPKKGPLEDVRIRHAVALLVDRKQIAERYFDRLARAALWPIWPGGLVHGVEPTVPAFDPKAAGALLDAAGWIDSDKDGIRDRNGQQLKLVMIGTESTARSTLQGPSTKLPREYLIDAARRIGLVIELKTGSESWVAKRLEDEKYDLVEMQWTGMVDMDLRKRFGGISPQIDKTLEAMIGVWDPAERGKLAGDLAAGLAAQWPMAGIVRDAPQGLIHRRVQGVRVWDGWIDLAKLSFSDDKR